MKNLTTVPASEVVYIDIYGQQITFSEALHELRNGRTVHAEKRS